MRGLSPLTAYSLTDNILFRIAMTTHHTLKHSPASHSPRKVWKRIHMDARMHPIQAMDWTFSPARTRGAATCATAGSKRTSSLRLCSTTHHQYLCEYTNSCPCSVLFIFELLFLAKTEFLQILSVRHMKLWHVQLCPLICIHTMFNILQWNRASLML